MKYTQEIVDELVSKYTSGVSAKDLAQWLTDETGHSVPERSVIAKLSAIGVYKRKEYVNKRGEAPLKKEVYIERIAQLLDIDVCLMESLEKVTKSALVLIERQIQEKIKE